MALKNIEIQLGQLMQAVQARNNTALQGDKGSNSKERSNVLPFKLKDIQREVLWKGRPKKPK